jgi:hypothetical protein
LVKFGLILSLWKFKIVILVFQTNIQNIDKYNIAINIQPYSFKEYAVANKDEKNTDRLFRKYINDSCF